MATEKIFLPVLFFIIFCSPAEGINKQIKFTKSQHYFPDSIATDAVSIVDAINFALGYFEGTVTKAEKKFKKDIPIWEIDLITAERGSIELEISSSDKNLIKVISSEGPFDYEIKPDKNFIAFSSAKKTAEDLTGQKILKWNYYKNRSRWEYNFWLFTKSGRAQVRVDAETGEVVSSKKKK